jgi:Major Facilitator Superfamily
MLFLFSAKFLTTTERREVFHRLQEDRNHLSDDFSLKYIKQAMTDWKIYVHMFITIGIFTPLYSISLFLPTIIKNLGYSNNTAQLMTVPPYVVACLFTIAAGYAADRMKQRGLFMLFFEVVAVLGFVLLLTTDKPGIQYTGTFLAASGMCSSPFRTMVHFSFQMTINLYYISNRHNSYIPTLPQYSAMPNSISKVSTLSSPWAWPGMEIILAALLNVPSA